SFPRSELRAYASPRSEGRKLPFAGGEVTCEVLREGCFDGLDLVVIDVDEPLALEWAPRAVAAGARVVDKSAAFRMEDDVPLVVAEVNPEDLRDMPRGIVSCPNCTTMVPLTALAPLHRAAGIERMVVATYQSVSGAGMPVYSGRAVAVNVQCRRDLSRADAVELLDGAPGVRLVDDGDGHPTPLEAAGIDPVLVGRVREGPSQERTLDLWVTGDNLRK